MLCTPIKVFLIPVRSRPITFFIIFIFLIVSKCLRSLWIEIKVRYPQNIDHEEWIKYFKKRIKPNTPLHTAPQGAADLVSKDPMIYPGEKNNDNGSVHDYTSRCIQLQSRINVYISSFLHSSLNYASLCVRKISFD